MKGSKVSMSVVTATIRVSSASGVGLRKMYHELVITRITITAIVTYFVSFRIFFTHNSVRFFNGFSLSFVIKFSPATVLMYTSLRVLRGRSPIR